MNLAELSWVQAEKALASTDLALVPVGAVEVYGPHLPQGSDGLVAQEVARRLAKRVPAVVTPLVPIGCSQMLMSFPGTLSVSSEALKAYLTDVADSLAHWGIKRILFMNGHAGNVPAIGEICREFGERGVRCAQVDWWRAVAKAAPDIPTSGEMAAGHAGENCTAVVMAVRNDLVAPDMMTKEMPKRGLAGKYPEIMQYDIPYRDVTASGLTGDPFPATVEKGEAMIERFLDRAEAFLKEWRNS
jgi:creatinine amidohydrolase